MERTARLEPAGADTDAAGEAEIEISDDSSLRYEIEFSVRTLELATTVTFLVDGQEVGRATVDRRGRAAVEIDVTRPTAAGAR